MYPDRVTAKACWDYHNKHPDSPRTDFKQNDVMAGYKVFGRCAVIVILKMTTRR